MSRFDGNRLSIVPLEGTIEINGRPAFLPVASVPLAAPFNLLATTGDTVINASVDSYPGIVDSYNWYLDGVLIATTADGAPSYQYTGLTNGQEYRVGVSVTVNGEESGILDWTNHVYDTLAKGHPTHVITGRANYAPQLYFYSGTFNRTYVVWMGKETDNSPAYIFYYDHDTGEISASTLIGTGDVGDNHLHGVVVVDNNGHIYVAWERTHNDSYILWKSNNPEDISVFTQLTDIGGTTNVTSPKLFVDSANTIFALGREKDGTTHDQGTIFKSVDSGVSFTEQLFADLNDGNRWFYNGILSSRQTEGLHIFSNILNETTLTYPDSHYIYTNDGVVFGNIEYYESGGVSGFSKDVSVNGALTKVELDTNFAIKLGLDSSKHNFTGAGGLSPTGNPVLIMNSADVDLDPDIQAWYAIIRENGAWKFIDISSIITLGDIRGVNVYLINDIELLSDTDWRVWTQDTIGGSIEITQYRTKDAGSSWSIEKYVSRNSPFPTEVGRAAITHNYFNAPKAIYAASYKNGAGYADIRTTIEIPALVTPEPNSSLSFDGVNDYVEIPHSTILDPRLTRTVEGWIKRGDLAEVQSLLWNRGNTNTGFYFAIISAGNLELAHLGVARVSSAGAITDQLWHHVAVTIDSGGNVVFYIDGASAGTATIAAPLTNTNPFFIAANQTSGSLADWHPQTSDELRVWNTVRTQQQIQDNMNKGLIGNETGLVGYWKFNEGSGTVLGDSTANNNDGTVVGATWSTDTPF